MPRQAPLFFQLRVQQVQRCGRTKRGVGLEISGWAWDAPPPPRPFDPLTLGIFGRAAIQRLLKEVACPLQLAAPVAGNELRQVGTPDVRHVGPLEQRDATLVCLPEGVLCVSPQQEDPSCPCPLLAHSAGPWPACLSLLLLPMIT